MTRHPLDDRGLAAATHVLQLQEWRDWITDDYLDEADIDLLETYLGGLLSVGASDEERAQAALGHALHCLVADSIGRAWYGWERNVSGRRDSSIQAARRILESTGDQRQHANGTPSAALQAVVRHELLDLYGNVAGQDAATDIAARKALAALDPRHVIAQLLAVRAAPLPSPDPWLVDAFLLGYAVYEEQFGDLHDWVRSNHSNLTAIATAMAGSYEATRELGLPHAWAVEAAWSTMVGEHLVAEGGHDGHRLHGGHSIAFDREELDKIAAATLAEYSHACQQLQDRPTALLAASRAYGGALVTYKGRDLQLGIRFVDDGWSTDEDDEDDEDDQDDATQDHANSGVVPTMVNRMIEAYEMVTGFPKGQHGA